MLNFQLVIVLVVHLQKLVHVRHVIVVNIAVKFVLVVVFAIVKMKILLDFVKNVINLQVNIFG